jgi:hypothetical protein
MKANYKNVNFIYKNYPPKVSHKRKEDQETSGNVVKNSFHKILAFVIKRKHKEAAHIITKLKSIKKSRTCFRKKS